MKTITLLLLSCVICQTAFSQDNQLPKSSSSSEINTILGNNNKSTKIPIGYFIEINAGGTKFGYHHGVLLPGFSLGIMLNHQWTIGLTVNYIDNPGGLKYDNIYYDSVNHNFRGVNLKGGYGGVLLEYTLFPKSRIHVAFPLMIGDGYFFYTQLPEYSSPGRNHRYNYHSYVSIDNCFVVEPGVRLEFNIVSFIRIGITLSYRYTPDLKLLNTSGDLINQFTGKISLRFGQF
jgi:hypothetical protein